MERYQVNNLEESISILQSGDIGIVAFDLDYVLRKSISHGLRGRFGEIPKDSLKLLKELKETGWIICVVTNQPRHGHQLARLVGGIMGYSFFPDSLEKVVGAEAIFGGDTWFCVPGYHYKKTDKSVSDVKKFISEVGDPRTVVMVGDKDTDCVFAEKLGADLFIKLPYPPYVDKIVKWPSPLKEIVLLFIP